MREREGGDNTMTSADALGLQTIYGEEPVTITTALRQVRWSNAPEGVRRKDRQQPYLQALDLRV